MRGSWMLLVATVTSLEYWTSASIGFPPRCSPSEHICEGACPPLPHGSEMPSEGDGLCLRDMESDACVCWLPQQQLHYRTLFKCEVQHRNGSMGHVMCLPPDYCFPANPTDPNSMGCMIVLRCPCTLAEDAPSPWLSRWRPVDAFILRSDTIIKTQKGEETQQGGELENKTSTREFSPKHLLFLLAFVIAPLLCWCTFRTFFHEGRCRRKIRGQTVTRSIAEEEPMRRAAIGVEEEECGEGSTETPPEPSAPSKAEISPPPYDEEDEETARLGPPPSYEEATRSPEQWLSTV